MTPDTGSFRDPCGRVYVSDGRILRGVDQTSLDHFRRLSEEPFFKKFLKDGDVVETVELQQQDPACAEILSDGWAGTLEHAVIPFVSYPYEWPFDMLKDAALLQLKIIEQSLESGWTLKDATPYNVQWANGRPVFIDVPSFEPWVEGEAWVGYRQFCAMFLTPLMLRAHLGIDHLPLLRAYLDGIPAMEAAKYFHGRKKLKRGVLSHIILPAKVEGRIASRERDRNPSETRKQFQHKKPMVIGLVQGLSRLVKKLSTPIQHTDWSQYDKTHSYEDQDFIDKKKFVAKNAGAKARNYIWDIGCNTGTFSKLVAEYCQNVVSADGDHDAIAQLYLEVEKDKDTKITPLVLNLANISPDQGWAGEERKAFDNRAKPDLVMCLALIHHTRISANIPNAMFLSWLRSLNSDVILEFVDRHDEMVVKLLTNKKEQYADYNLEGFLTECESMFTIADRAPLKNGSRQIFYLTPK